MRNVPLTISSYTLGTEINFEDRVKIAKEAGYDGIGLRAETYMLAVKQGYSDERMLEILAEHDMKVTEVEYITLWADPNKTIETPETLLQQFKEQTIYHMARLFGVGHINCGLMEKYPAEVHIQAFKELCTRSKELVIGLEFMPYSGVPDLASAWNIVKEADCDNGMLILDTWHWARANMTAADLEGVPAEKVVSIQICDVLERRYPDTILRDESMHDRLCPGTGWGDTEGFLRALKAHGIKPRVVGTEVISDPILSQGYQKAAEQNYKTSIEVIQNAWPELLA
ncbi:sugar phosphate isomerase/epimerase family protein [Enterococcus casseliflavus]|uniref:sugar phosphate isomerase/epimerase family protein n=1 Tax=Enterococcus casseliflavus TaxID=37734 RepID=UPI001BCEC896|nr:sugar phosphate isomerase/epimerase [Enterococcus casseliflavus]